VGLRARELARRPLVVTVFALQATAVAAAELLAAVTAEGLAGAGDDLVLGGLRLIVAPGGLVFGVLVAAVVGAEFGWATERALLARDPRRLRFAGYQLAVAAVLALAWWAVQSLLAVAVAALLQAGGGIVAGASWARPAPWSCGAPWPGWSPSAPTGCWSSWCWPPNGTRPAAGPYARPAPAWPARATSPSAGPSW
jgi:hypothetical protein